MPLSAEQQALFDHARRAVPRWLTRGKNAALEWLHGYTEIFDPARVQGQDWLDATFIDTAVGVELDQHATDRGLQRRSGETDESLRQRIKNISDTLTEPVLKAQVDAFLDDASLDPSAWVELRRDKAHLRKGHNGYPVSIGALQSAFDFRNRLFINWSSIWSCDEGSSPLVPDVGAPNLVAVSTPTYGNAGLILSDFAVGFNSSADAFSGGDVHDVTATDDLLFALVLKTSSITGGNDILSKGDVFGNNPGYMLVRETDTFGLYVGDGVTNTSVSVPGILANTWYLVVGVFDRTRGEVRLGAMPFDTQLPIVSDAADISGLGSLGNASNFILGDQGEYRAGNLQVAYLAVGVGASYAGDVFASHYLIDELAISMKSFWYYVLPDQAFLDRGYRMAYAQQPQAYIVILPYGTTDELAAVITEYLRVNGPAGYNYYIEVRGVP